MKTKIRFFSFLAAVLLLCSSFAIIGCGGGGGSDNPIGPQVNNPNDTTGGAGTTPPPAKANMQVLPRTELTDNQKAFLLQLPDFSASGAASRRSLRASGMVDTGAKCKYKNVRMFNATFTPVLVNKDNAVKVLYLGTVNKSEINANTQQKLVYKRIRDNKELEVNLSVGVVKELDKAETGEKSNGFVAVDKDPDEANDLTGARGVTVRFKQLAENFIKTLLDVQYKLNQLELKVDENTGKISCLDKRIEIVEKEVQENREKIERVEERINQLEKQQEESNQRDEARDKEIKDLKEEIAQRKQKDAEAEEEKQRKAEEEKQRQEAFADWLKEINDNLTQSQEKQKPEAKEDEKLPEIPAAEEQEGSSTPLGAEHTYLNGIVSQALSKFANDDKIQFQTGSLGFEFAELAGNDFCDENGLKYVDTGDYAVRSEVKLTYNGKDITVKLGEPKTEDGVTFSVNAWVPNGYEYMSPYLCLSVDSNKDESFKISSIKLIDAKNNAYELKLDDYGEFVAKKAQSAAQGSSSESEEAALPETSFRVNKCNELTKLDEVDAVSSSEPITFNQKLNLVFNENRMTSAFSDVEGIELPLKAADFDLTKTKANIVLCQANNTVNLTLSCGNQSNFNDTEITIAAASYQDNDPGCNEPVDAILFSLNLSQPLPGYEITINSITFENNEGVKFTYELNDYKFESK